MKIFSTSRKPYLFPFLSGSEFQGLKEESSKRQSSQEEGNPERGFGNLEGVILTQEHEVSVVLQHHVPVQFPLCVAQASPLLLGEFYGHVPECQQSLQDIPQSPSGH